MKRMMDVFDEGYRKDTQRLRCGSFHYSEKHYVVIVITTTYYNRLRKMHKNCTFLLHLSDY